MHCLPRLQSGDRRSGPKDGYDVAAAALAPAKPEARATHALEQTHDQPGLLALRQSSESMPGAQTLPSLGASRPGSQSHRSPASVAGQGSLTSVSRQSSFSRRLAPLVCTCCVAVAHHVHMLRRSKLRKRACVWYSTPPCMAGHSFANKNSAAHIVYQHVHCVECVCTAVCRPLVCTCVSICCASFAKTACAGRELAKQYHKTGR